jgi:hypothetical protein
LLGQGMHIANNVLVKGIDQFGYKGMVGKIIIEIDFINTEKSVRV